MRKVMVLEDEASIRSFIVINLRRAGYEVVEAETGEEALDKLHANPDTLVALLDVMLPGVFFDNAVGKDAYLGLIFLCHFLPTSFTPARCSS